jgi:hypothetical protein
MPEVTVPHLPLTGRCQCGAVSYRINGAPLSFYLCHCTECQKQSASAFGESLQVNTADVSYAGELGHFFRVTDSGRNVDAVFCPKRGTRISHHAAGETTMTIKAGTLDDRSWLRPAGHIWARSRQPWVTFGPGELVFEMRPEKGVIHTRWMEMTGS